jgi:sugar phosphate permease
MLSLILAGETVFLPAFHLGRYFKTALLSSFHINEFQLGRLGAVYGLLATVCYFLGGPLADRWPPRKMISASLVVTALGSLYMATFPGFSGLRLLFGFWGITTILAFWAPLIRATQIWGGKEGQGRAFGILDGGRGLASAVIASAAAYWFAAMVGDSETPDAAMQEAAVRKLIYSYAGYCIFAAVMVWFFVPDPDPADEQTFAKATTSKTGPIGRLFLVLRSPAIWLQAVVIIAAYSAFKMIDNYGLYAEDAYGLNQADSAKLVARISYLRVGAALAAGWVADRLLGVRPTIQCCFGILLVAYVMLLAATPNPNYIWYLIVSLAISCVGFFALRGIYFALLEDSHIPTDLTGTAVGILCFVGFTPEIFMGPLTGWLITESRAAGNVLPGYRQIYWILLSLTVSGMIATFALRWQAAPKKAQERGASA